MAAGQVAPLRPAEFCALERALIASMAMRKKRRVKMEPVQELKLRLLDCVEDADPEPERFASVLAEAVLTVSGSGGTGPAQAVASDLQMDWELSLASPGFVDWLRKAAARESSAKG
jgi:hypothetical protein